MDGLGGIDHTMLARQFQANNNSRPTFLFPLLAAAVASLACCMIVGTDRLRSSGCFDMRSETICVLRFMFQTNDSNTTSSYSKNHVLTSVDKVQQVSSRRNRTIDVPEDHVDVASFSLERVHQTRRRRRRQQQRQRQQQQRPKQEEEDKEEDIVGVTPPLLDSQGIEKWSNEEENGERGDTTTLLELEGQQQQRQRQRRPSYVKKTVYSDTVRFLFIASQDGTGHHGWHQALAWNHVCQQPNGTTFDSMSRVYFRSSNELTMNAEQLRHDLRANVVQAKQEQQQRQQRDSGHSVEPTMFCLNTLTSPMMSYPNGRGHIDKHPDINLLAQIAEDAGVDLRIITLHRPPANIVVSCSVHRNFGTPYREALLQIDQTAFLISQLESIDPAFYTCTATSEVVETATHIQDHVFGGMTGKMATVLMPAINKTFVDRTDNETKARIEIKDKLLDMMMMTMTTTTMIDRDGERRDDTDDEGAAVAVAAAGSIDRLLDELDTSYLYFRNVVCANKR